MSGRNRVRGTGKVPDVVAAATDALFELAVSLGGSISGEHGIGLTKRGNLALQASPRELDLHYRIKQTLDPLGLLNPVKKV